jgi:hypothetical protein
VSLMRAVCLLQEERARGRFADASDSGKSSASGQRTAGLNLCQGLL